MGRFFSSEEVAARYSVKTTTVLEWIRRGELPAIKIGKLYRVRSDDLEAFEQRRRTVPQKGNENNE